MSRVTEDRRKAVLSYLGLLKQPDPEAELQAEAPPRPGPAASPAAAQKVATVTDLIVYPLKSGGGASVRSAELTPKGLRYDRCWAVVDADGFVQDQR